MHCQFFSCVFPFYFLTGEFIATLLLFSLMVGCTSLSFRQWNAVPAPNPATCTQPTWGPCSLLVCFEGDNFFLGVLTVLKQHQTKIWCYLRRIVITNPAAMCPKWAAPTSMCCVAWEKRSALLFQLSLGPVKLLSANGCICL